MSDKEMFPYIEKPETSDGPFLSDSLNLQDLYEQCVQELGLQQNKRDQLIAFYLTITGLVSTYLFSSEISLLIKCLVFFALFVIGYMWLTVILRYRTYKEVYWLCCKTLSGLFSVERSKIDKPLLQHKFYATMEKCAKTAKIYENGKSSLWKLIWKNHTSAEYIMFMTLAVLAGFCGTMGIILVMNMCALSWPYYFIAAAVFLAFLFLETIRYNKEIIKTYEVLKSKTNDSFNGIFEKAWFLHFFVGK